MIPFWQGMSLTPLRGTPAFFPRQLPYLTVTRMLRGNG